MEGKSALAQIENKKPEKKIVWSHSKSNIPGSRFPITHIWKKSSHLITYESGDNKTQVDYILFRRSLRKYIRDVKVIPGEEC